MLPDDGNKSDDIVEAKFGGFDRLLVTHEDEGHFDSVPGLVEQVDPKLAVPLGAKHFDEAPDIDPDIDSSMRTAERIVGETLENWIGAASLVSSSNSLPTTLTPPNGTVRLRDRHGTDPPQDERV